MICTAAYRRSNAAGKQKQMLSSILPSPHFSLQIFHLPLSYMSQFLFLLIPFFSSFSSWEAESLISIRISVCLIQFLLRIPGAQVQSGSVSICMEIGYFPGVHWGHTSTTAAQVWTYRGSAGGGDVCVCVCKCLCVSKASKNISGFIPSDISRCLLIAYSMFSVSCAQTAYKLQR